MAKLKQRFRVMPAFSGRDKMEGKLQVGTVVYVHPMMRYAVLEFDGVYGKPRESFHMDELIDRNQVKEKTRAVPMSR